MEMGTRDSRFPPWGGGRWSAVYSLWTYFHRLLHVVGISSVDHEEVALLSAPLVRIHPARAPRQVLAHVLDPLAPAEPLGVVPVSTVLPEQSLFLLHFIPADPAGPVTDANHARLATAFPTATSPRAWIAVDPKTGHLSFSASEHNAAVFKARLDANARASGAHAAQVSLRLSSCAAGAYLSTGAPNTTRVRVCAPSVGRTELFHINTIPASPCAPRDDPAAADRAAAAAAAHTALAQAGPRRLRRSAAGDSALDLQLHAGAPSQLSSPDPGAAATALPAYGGLASPMADFALQLDARASASALQPYAAHEHDPTIAAVLRQSRSLPVRLQSAAHGWFVASSPGAPLAATSGTEVGWDALVMEFDAVTNVARLRDSRGLYLALAADQRSFTATITSDDHTGVGYQAGAAGGEHHGHAAAASGNTTLSGRSLSASGHKAEKTLSLGEQEKEDVKGAPLRAKPRSPSPQMTRAVENGRVNASTAGARSAGEGQQDVSTRSSPVRAERFVIALAGDGDEVTLRGRKGYLSAQGKGRVTTSQNTVPGIRERFVLRLALPSMMDQSTPSLRLRHRAHGFRDVDASIVVPASAALTFGVLRDYDGFKHFIEDCVDSGVESRAEDGSLVVRMVQAHTFLVLTLCMQMTLRVREDGEEYKVFMELLHGLGVKAYSGVWHALQRTDGRCELRISLSSAPAVPAPNFLMDGIMCQAVRDTLEQVRSECIVRSSRGCAASP